MNLRNVTLRPLNELFQKLLDMDARYVDTYMPVKNVRAVLIPDETVDGAGRALPIASLGITTGHGVAELSPNALDGLVQRTGADGPEVRADYLRKLNALREPASVKLAEDNINFWLKRRGEETHKNGQLKSFLLRLAATEPIKDENGKIDPAKLKTAVLRARAVLSDRFLPIDNLSLITTLWQVMQDKFNFDGSVRDACTSAVNHAKGAISFSHQLSETSMNVCLMNPCMLYDTGHPENGVMSVTYNGPDGNGGHSWTRPDGGIIRLGDRPEGGGHYMFPVARVTNSETGGGSAEVTFGLFQVACANGMIIGQASRRAHIGALMQQDEGESKMVRDQRLKLIHAKIADAVRGVFDPDVFEKSCREWLKLFDEPVENVAQAFESICRLPGLTVDMAKMMLEAYHPNVTGKHTLGDVQCAVTNVAHSFDDPDKVRALQDAGGAIVVQGRKVLQLA